MACHLQAGSSNRHSIFRHAVAGLDGKQQLAAAVILDDPGQDRHDLGRLGSGNCLLDGSVLLLKDSPAKLGSDAEVTIVPGMNHTMHRAGIQTMMERVSGVKAEEAEKK